jgi:DNA-binding response OmpR family regulator
MKCIVVVEDDKWLGAHFVRTLERAGFEVYLATDGPGAIDVIDEMAPDGIVLDVLLENSTAPALLHELQSHHDLANIPVLIVTNIADRVDPAVIKRYGVHDVIDKAELTPDQLVKEVQKMT